MHFSMTNIVTNLGCILGLVHAIHSFAYTLAKRHTSKGTGMIKRVLHSIALRGEILADRLFHRTDAGREIDAYIGYATPDQIILRGRVLSALRHATPTAAQSKWQNFRQILGMFFTDEVRGATVRSGATAAISDEEGYFTLTLPRDHQTGWRTEYVYVEGRSDPVACPVLVPRHDARFMVISDIDDTMMETGAYSLLRNLYTSFTGNSTTRQIYPDARDLMDRLSAGGQNPVFYVSSSPWNLHDFLSDVFDTAGLVKGPMFLRDLGLSTTKFITEGHGNHKGASIDLILRANPDLPAILLGDTGQHDAAIYRDVIERHPGRIVAVGLRTPGPGLDAADRHDLSALNATHVPTFATRDFSQFADKVAAARPDLF